jgi:hypothetical protein
VTPIDSFDETYSFFYDTILSYLDQEEPDALDRFLASTRRAIFGSKNFGSLTADYVALAVHQLVRLRVGSFLSQFLRDGDIPEWGVIRPHLEVHQDARDFIKSFEQADQEILTLAVLTTLRYGEDRPGASDESDETDDDDIPYDMHDEAYESDFN